MKLSTTRILIVLALLLTSQYACLKDPIDQNENLTDEYIPYAFTDNGELLLALDSIYSILQLGEKVERIEFWGTICSGDAMAGGVPGGADASPMQSMMKFVLQGDNSYSRDYWKMMFTGISLTNKFLLNLEESETTAGIDEALISRTSGEAYFLKALFYYKLALMFCGFPQMQDDYGNSLLGVPIMDKVFDPDSLKSERPPLTETWEAITAYFLAAAELLPERSEYTAIDRGRASKGSALAMLAKVSVFTEQWAEGFDYAQRVIGSGEYFLEGDNDHPGPYVVTRLTKEGLVDVAMPAYKWIWQPEADNCGENIFDVQHDADHSTLYPEGQEGNLIPQYYLIRSVFTYNSAGHLVSSFLGWGFILPTHYFVETAYRDAGGVDPAGNILDPRYKLSVIAEGDSVPYHYSDETLRLNYPDSVLFDAWNNWPCTGFATWKYFTDPYYLEQRSTLGDNPQNTKFFRFADLLLLGAEAALHLGNTNQALEWTNKVRERARNSGNTGYPKPLTSLGVEDIWAERRVELAFEGHQFPDLIRTRRAAQVLTTDAMVYESVELPGIGETSSEQFGARFVAGKSELLPVPEVAIENSGGLITQNPGY